MSQESDVNGTELLNATVNSSIAATEENDKATLNIPPAESKPKGVSLSATASCHTRDKSDILG
jgi:hypothetical protein